METAERRLVAIVDGDRRHDLALPLDLPMGAALERIGISPLSSSRVLLDRAGRQIDAIERAEAFPDGVVLSVVDLDAVVQREDGPRPSSRQPVRSGAVWWMLAASGLVLSILALVQPHLFPADIDSLLRIPIVAVAAVGALTSATVWAARARRDEPAAVAASLGPLALAFAAGVVAIPPLPGGTAMLAVVTGLLSVTILASLLAIIVRAPVVRAELTMALTIVLGLTVLWGGALLLSLPVTAPAAIALGAVPVLLRALPSTLMDVPPGTFIDHERFQVTRWTVRESFPDPVGSIAAKDARELVERSAARLLVGTCLFSVIAVVCAPLAVPGFEVSDPLVFSGRIALVSCVAVGLLLGARRSAAPALRWMPRAAALVVIVVATTGVLAAVGEFSLVLGAVLLLVGGIGTAFVVVPVARGAQSLFWSRMGDVFEWIAVVLALPAGLLAANAIGVLRGMMGG